MPKHDETMAKAIREYSLSLLEDLELSKSKEESIILAIRHLNRYGVYMYQKGKKKQQEKDTGFMNSPLPHL